MLPAELVSMFGCGIVNPVLSGLVLSTAPKGQEGLAVGVHDTARHAGIALGVAVLGALIPSQALATGHGEAAFVHGFHHAVWVATAVAALGALVTWVLVRPTKQTDPDVELAELTSEAELAIA
jgi:MFS family permease